MARAQLSFSYEAAFNAHDVDAVMSRYASGARWFLTNGHELRGGPAIRSTLEHAFASAGTSVAFREPIVTTLGEYRLERAGFTRTPCEGAPVEGERYALWEAESGLVVLDLWVPADGRVAPAEPYVRALADADAALGRGDARAYAAAYADDAELVLSKGRRVERGHAAAFLADTAAMGIPDMRHEVLRATPVSEGAAFVRSHVSFTVPGAGVRVSGAQLAVMRRDPDGCRTVVELAWPEVALSK